MHEKQISIIKKHLIVRDDQILASSLDVSNFFNKKHLHVLEAIRKLEVPEAFSGSNFRSGSYADAQNQMRPMVEMTRDGFTILAMGFTGSEAMKFKLAYIEAFNQMEKALLENAMDRAQLSENAAVLTKDRYIDLLETENKFLKGEKLRTHRTPIPLTDDDKREIITLYANGMSQAEIARKVKRSSATISYLVRDKVKESMMGQEVAQ